MKAAKEASKKNVFVTVCNGRDILSAKQLFAAAATKGRWEGDYCLICRDVEEDDIRWFRDRGVVVMPAGPVVPEETWNGHKKLELYPQVAILKFHMFTEAFRRWDSVVYMDTDILIRGPIGCLAEVGDFSAVPDPFLKIRKHFLGSAEKRHLPEKRILEMKAFNAGVLAFRTASIPKNAYEDLVEIAERTVKGARFSDQSFMNVYFAETWKQLPAEFNSMAVLYGEYGTKRDKKILFGARIVHYAGNRKPSEPDNPGNREWEENLRTAEAAASFHALDPTGSQEPVSSARSVEQVHAKIRALRPINQPIRRLRRFSRHPGRILRRRLAILMPRLQKAE